MKVEIERGELLKALSHVHAVVERRNTIPILSNVLLDARDDHLSLTATDLEIAVVEGVGARVLTPGATTVPAHTLHDIVRKLPDGAMVELDATAEENRLTLSSGRSRFALSCLPKDDFPVMAEGDLPCEFEVPVNDLKRLIEKARFAISTEETRYYLNGIYLHAADEGGAPMLRAVATDGHRLAQVQAPLPSGADAMPGVIVPRKTVAEILRLLDGAGDKAVIALSDTKIRISMGAVVLSSKLIDGTFPDYGRVIPAGNDKTMTIDRPAFTAAVDRVSTISSDKSRRVKLSAEGGHLTLTASSPEAGSAVEELAVGYDNESLTIGFNAKYLMDIATQIDGDEVEFVMDDAASPTIIRDSSDDGALYVLMPMRA